jgi:hypothetical protein
MYFLEVSIYVPAFVRASNNRGSSVLDLMLAGIRLPKTGVLLMALVTTGKYCSQLSIS